MAQEIDTYPFYSAFSHRVEEETEFINKRGPDVRPRDVKECVLCLYLYEISIPKDLSFYKSYANLWTQYKGADKDLYDLYKRNFHCLTANDNDRLQSIFQLIQHLREILVIWKCPKDKVLSEIEKIYIPLGLPLKMIRKGYENDFEGFKEQIGDECVCTDMGKPGILYSIALILLADNDSTTGYKKEAGISMEDTTDEQWSIAINKLLYMYRIYIDVKAENSVAYNDWVNVMKMKYVQYTQLDEWTYDLLSKYTRVELYWKSTLNFMFQAVAPFSMVEENYKEKMFLKMDEYSEIILPYYDKYCEENNIPNERRLHFHTEAANDSSRELFYIQKDFFRLETDKSNNGHLTLRNEVKGKGVSLFSDMVYSLIEDGYLDENMKTFYLFIYRLSGIKIMELPMKEKIVWHKDGKVLRWIVTHLCDDGVQKPQLISPYFYLDDEKGKSLADITASEAKNIKRTHIYKMFLMNYDHQTATSRI